MKPRIDAGRLCGQPPSGSVKVEVAVNAHLHPVAEDEPMPVEEQHRNRSRWGAKKATCTTALDSAWSSASVK